jgi:hypothetical protein
MEIPLRLLNEIKEYCKTNGIRDHKAFCVRCIEQGFSIVKYGVSPMDNINRENDGIKDNKKVEQVKTEPVVIVRPVAEEKVEETPVVEEPVRPKRKGVKIIKKS